MPWYRFAWNAFEDADVLTLATERSLTFTDVAEARKALEQDVPRPTPEFVRRHRDFIQRWIARDDARLMNTVERLQQVGLGPWTGHVPNPQEALRFLAQCRNSSRFRQILLKPFIGYGNTESKATIEAGSVRSYAVITPAHQAVDTRTAHDFQNEAHAALVAAYNVGLPFAELLEMPTGAGKTFTAVRWALQFLLSKGVKLLWIAHRQELLNQAHRTILSLSHLIENRERVRVRVVSGAHDATTTIDPADDIIIASIGSLARRPDIADMLVADPNRFVIIDEAHHAASSTYLRLLTSLRTREKYGYLGLTATFTRTTERERPVLKSLFPKSPVFSIAQRRLIELGILSSPNIESVPTRVNAQTTMTAEDYAHLRRFGELSEEHLDRLARLAPRNKAVVDTYLQHQERYGKTLIFAINVDHAAMLTAMLREQLPEDHRSRVEYVATRRPDGSTVDDGEVFARFRLPGTEPAAVDVLVNVQIATEGVDFPQVQTVFLVRPTASTILLRQMVGRALRGTAAGGTEKAYVVNFTDEWEHLRNFDLPIRELCEPAPPPPLPPAPTDPAASAATEPPVPWTLILEAANLLKNRAPEAAQAFELVPVGWWLLRDAGPGEVLNIPVLSFHKDSWDALKRALEQPNSPTPSVEEVLKKYFEDCDEPWPAEADLESFLVQYQERRPMPEFVPFVRRAEMSPTNVATAIIEGDLGERARTELMRKSYGELAQAIYPTFEVYRAAVDRAIGEAGQPSYAPPTPIFDPRPDQTLPYTEGFHELDTLLDEVIQEGAALLNVEKLPGSPEVDWTHNIVKSHFGKAYFNTSGPPGEGRIMMNRLLQSKEVTTGTIKFLLWHEYLHLLLLQGHTATFRDYERRWPGHATADRELDTLGQRFNLQYR